MLMKKSLQFTLLIVASVSVLAEPPAYGTSAFTTGYGPTGHGSVGYQSGYQSGYQGGYHGGYQGGYRAKYQGGYDEGVPHPFSFQYEVKDPQSGNDYGHHATSDGRNVQGEYQVLLPDGRRQIVKYTADDNGYNADVRYEGQTKQYQAYGGYSSGGYTGGYSGHTGYTGLGGYSGYTGQRARSGSFTAQKPIYGGYAR